MRRRIYWMLVVTLAASSASATTYSVASLLDGVAADGECRLREAMRAANTDLAVNECPAGGPEDTIVLATVGTYRFDQGEEEASMGILNFRGGSTSADAHQVDLGGVNRFFLGSGGIMIRFENLTLKNGFASMGGALSFPSGDFELRNVTIRSSRATSAGGAIYFGTGGDGNGSRIERSRFLDNEVHPLAMGSGRGGGVALSLSHSTELTIETTSFERNSASALGAGSMAAGGALSVIGTGPNCELRIRNVSFVDNVSTGELAWGAAVSATLSASATVVGEDLVLTGNVVFQELPSGRGAVLDFDLTAAGAQALELRRFAVQSNPGSASTDAQLSLRLGGSAQAIVDSGLVADGLGPGVLLGTANEAEALLGQLTVARNGGSGLQVFDASSLPPRLENSILWGNQIPGQAPEDLVIVTGSIDADRVANHNWIGSQGDPDPLFVEAPGGDYSLQALSGAVDAGDAAFDSVGPFDLRHSRRVVHGQIDLGAFERGGLFADDFESESTGAWSSSAP